MKEKKTDKLKPTFEKVKVDDKVIAQIELSKLRGLGSAPDYFKR